MGTVLRVWTQEEVRSVIRFLWAKGTAPIEIHREIHSVYGSNVMTVQHVWKWCREFSGCRLSVTDEQRSGRPSMSADLSLQLRRLRANRRVLLKELEEQFNLSRGTRGCCCCMIMPDRIQLMRQWISWNDGAGKFLSTRPTARICHLRTFISSPTWKNIFVPSDSNHMMQTWLRGQDPTFYR